MLCPSKGEGIMEHLILDGGTWSLRSLGSYEAADAAEGYWTGCLLGLELEREVSVYPKNEVVSICRLLQVSSIGWNSHSPHAIMPPSITATLMPLMNVRCRKAEIPLLPACHMHWGSTGPCSSPSSMFFQLVIVQVTCYLLIFTLWDMLSIHSTCINLCPSLCRAHLQ